MDSVEQNLQDIRTLVKMINFLSKSKNDLVIFYKHNPNTFGELILTWYNRKDKSSSTFIGSYNDCRKELITELKPLLPNLDI